MPGILGIVGPHIRMPENAATVARMAEPLRYADGQTVKQIRTGRFGGAVVDYGPSFGFLKPAAAQRNGVVVLMDGEVFPEACDVPHALQSGAVSVQRAEYCLHLYLTEGPEFVRRLNGSFTLAVYDSRSNQVHLYTDRVASRSLMIWRDQSELAFASAVRSLLCYRDDIGRRYDELALAELILFERVLGERTLFSDIRRLPPACHAMWDGKSLHTDRYWEYKPSGPRPFSDWREAGGELVRRLASAVEARTSDQGGRGLLVGGGLDSRLVLALCPQDVITATLANPDGRGGKEWALATRVSRAADVTLLSLARHAEYCVTMAEQGAEISEGLHTFTGYHTVGVHQQLVEAGVQQLITGLWFDTCFKGYYANDVGEVALPNTSNLVRARGMARHLADTSVLRRGHHQDLLVMALTDAMKNAGAVARECAVRNMTARLSEGAPLGDLIERLIGADLQVSAISGFSKCFMSRFIDRSPIFDNGLLECAAMIPSAWKRGGRIVRHALTLASPRLARITDNNTGCPAGWCSELGLAAVKGRESLRRAARWLSQYSSWIASLRQSGRPVFTSNYPLSFDGALKLVPAYRSLVENAVEKLNTKYFDVETVRDLLRDDLRSSQPRLRSLFEIIVTFSLFDQKWGPQRPALASHGKAADKHVGSNEIVGT